MKKSTSFVYLSVLFSAILAACATSPQATATMAVVGELPTITSTELSDPEAVPGTLTIYSGRSENLVGPIIEQFASASGIEVQVRYGSTAELAAAILEEGANSPADIFFAQDPGGLGAVAEAGLLAQLPAEVLGRVDASFSSSEGEWVGISGRARVVVYNTDVLSEADLPADLAGFTDPQWAGRLGVPASNASFQTMVTAMRSLWGEAETRTWLEGIVANDPVYYENNASVVAGVAAGEVDAGFVNHYYLYRFLAEEGDSFPARNYYLPSGGPGSLVMVAGAGQLASSQNTAAAQRFLEFMLSAVAQQYFASQTFEYPLVEGVVTSSLLKPLAELSAPSIALADLADLPGTAELLQSVGMLP